MTRMDLIVASVNMGRQWQHLFDLLDCLFGIFRHPITLLNKCGDRAIDALFVDVISWSPIFTVIVLIFVHLACDLHDTCVCGQSVNKSLPQKQNAFEETIVHMDLFSQCIFQPLFIFWQHFIFHCESLMMLSDSSIDNVFLNAGRFLS